MKNDYLQWRIQLKSASGYVIGGQGSAAPG